MRFYSSTLKSYLVLYQETLTGNCFWSFHKRHTDKWEITRLINTGLDWIISPMYEKDEIEELDGNCPIPVWLHFSRFFHNAWFSTYCFNETLDCHFEEKCLKRRSNRKFLLLFAPKRYCSSIIIFPRKPILIKISITTWYYNFVNLGETKNIAIR